MPISSRFIDSNLLANLSSCGFDSELLEGAVSDINADPLRVCRSHLNADDNEVVLKYHHSSNNPSGIYIVTGAGIDHDEIKTLLGAYLATRIPNALNSSLEKSFLEELRDRNYDLTSFRLSIRKQAGATKRYGTPRWKPRQLKMQYGRLEGQTPDMCYLYGDGIQRCDPFLLNYVFSSYRYNRMQRDYSKPLLDELKMAGLDIKTIKFHITKAR